MNYSTLFFAIARIDVPKGSFRRVISRFSDVKIAFSVPFTRGGRDPNVPAGHLGGFKHPEKSYCCNDGEKPCIVVGHVAT